MNKNVVKICSGVMSALMMVNSLPINSEVKATSRPLTKTEKIIISAGGIGGAVLLGGIVLLGVLRGKNSDTTTNYPQYTDNAPGVSETYSMDPRVTCVKNPTSHIEIVEHNLKKWICSKNNVDRKMLNAALNIYSLKIFGRNYSDALNDSGSSLSNTDRKKCLTVIGTILVFLKDYTDSNNLNVEAYVEIDTHSMAEALVSVLETAPDSLSADMNKELEVLRAGKQIDFKSWSSYNRGRLRKPSDSGTDSNNRMIIDRVPVCTHSEILDFNLKQWVSSTNEDDRKALFAALNVYSLKVFGKKYNEVLEECKNKLGADRILLYYYLTLEKEGSKYYDNEEKRKCVLTICSILLYFDEIEIISGADQKLYTNNVAEILTPILEDKSDNLSSEIRAELEILKNGKWSDLCSNWQLK